MSETAQPRRVGATVRITLTIVGWSAFVYLLHAAMHAYEAELAPILRGGPGFAAQVAVVAGLLYVVLASLRLAPRLGPRGALALALWAGLIVLGHAVSHLELHEARALIEQARGGMGENTLLICAGMYALLLAFPFVPGLELGLLMMSMFGREGALVVYAATVLGLNLAFVVGRWLPRPRLGEGIAASSVREDAAAPSASLDDMLGRLAVGRRLPRRLLGLVSRYRYLAVAVLLNLPGNSALGGGGGIALACGLGRLLRWPGFLLATALATLPVPLLALLGLLDLEAMLRPG